MANQTNTKCLIGEARMNWPRVFAPEAFNGGEPKYNVTLSFPKSDTKLLATIQAAIEECAEKARTTMFGGKLPKNFELPNIKDGDDDFDGEGYPGQWVIKASSKFKPEVVKKMKVAGQPQFVQITDEDEFYGGCYGYASVTFRAFAVEVNKDFGVCVLNEHTCIGCFFCHVTLAVNKLNERKVIASANLCVVLTECGSDMNDTCTVCHCNIVVCCNEETFFILFFTDRFNIIKERFVLFVFKVDTLETFKHFVCRRIFCCEFSENFIKKCLCHIVCHTVCCFYFAVNIIGIYAKCNV